MAWILGNNIRHRGVLAKEGSRRQAQAIFFVFIILHECSTWYCQQISTDYITRVWKCTDFLFNSLPASIHFCRLLVTFCKQFGPRSGPTIMSGLIWVQTVCNSDGNSEERFEKVDFEQKSADDKNHAKITQHAKS